MKINKIVLSALLAVSLLMLSLAGCGGIEGNNTADNESSSQSDISDVDFSYSEGIDENGYWSGIKALDYVELLNYNGIEIPKEIHEISDEAVQSEIDSILENYSESQQVKDRAVVDGDTVNIDYVGSVDGVEFEGGNTGGTGTDVTIGVTSYIDDFLEQLIGHTPGETINVEVTFPEDYGQEHLDGKDALFVTTINYIVENVKVDLTDGFVSENLNADYGWTTVDEMKTGNYTKLQETALSDYIQEHLVSDSTIISIPDEIMEYQKKANTKYFQDYATSNSMEFEDFLNSMIGVSTVEELHEQNQETYLNAANFSLVIQAIAEDAKITVSDEDIQSYFLEDFGTDDYSQYEDQYGKAYLKQIVLSGLVIDFITENAVLK